ncbi:MAG: hypothetical protein U0165_18570 [Polyangiaceae bacterium]
MRIGFRYRGPMSSLRGSLALAFVMISGALIGCASPTRAQRAQSDLKANMGLRFGAMSRCSAVGSVECQAEVLEQYGSWHREIRIIDLDIVGMVAQADDSFDVMIAVQWRRAHRRGHPQHDDFAALGQPERYWSLLSSERVQGDRGLIADATPQDAADTAAQGPTWSSRYQTTIIRE